jgi:putative sterol carrier protein
MKKGVEEMEIADDIAVKEYFEEIVPGIFASELAKSPVLGMEGTEFILQFDVVGAEKQTYNIGIKDAKDMEVKAGPSDKAIVAVEIGEDDWREAVTGKVAGAVDMFTDTAQLANKAKYDLLKSTKGTLNLDLSREGGDNIAIKIVFNGADSPAVTFRLTLDDWVLMSRGELVGVTAFMSGKLKIEGDMPFAMALGNLTA